MSETSPEKGFSNKKTIIFVIVLSFTCALILSLLASVLAKPKEIAKDLDRSKQMMIAAKVLDHEGYFLITNSDGKHIPAKLDSNGMLVVGDKEDIASREQLLQVYKQRFLPLLVNDKGDTTTFVKANINFDNYANEFKKTGYYKQSWKLIYEIRPNSSEDKNDAKPEGFVIPINGFGLWDAIYGYLAIKPDGNTITGITWYDQKETPGLGANISEAYWQNLFIGKHLFLESADGKTNYKSAPLGITVIKGKVSEMLGSSPKAMSAVDGMTGATLTGNGVTDAYREVLKAYRPFLIKLHDQNK